MYSVNFLYCGGWCKVCLFFLIIKEKDVVLGVFVKLVFKNYSKLKEKFDLYELVDYYKRVEECGLYVKI